MSSTEQTGRGNEEPGLTQLLQALLSVGTSLLCFLSFQLFFLAILFKFTYYSQNYS